MKYPKSSYAHTRYEDKAGNYLPGVTTIGDGLAKPFLITWANRLGLEGIDTNKLKDALARIGTLSHALIEQELTGNKVELDDYSKNEIDAAQIPLNKFMEWQKNRNFSAEAAELSLVSERYKFGGTCDLYGTLDGVKTLIDIKTSNSCYIDHKIQVSAYKVLLEENGYKVDQVKILRVGRDGKEGADEIEVARTDELFTIFLCLLKIYQVKKGLEPKRTRYSKKGGRK